MRYFLFWEEGDDMYEYSAELVEFASLEEATQYADLRKAPPARSWRYRIIKGESVMQEQQQ